MAFFAASFTADVVYPHFSEDNISFIMTTWGEVNATTSYAIGHISDKIGRRIPLFFGYLLHLICLAFLIYSSFVVEDTARYFIEYPWLMYVVSGLYSAGDASLGTILSTIVSVFYATEEKSKMSNAFSIVRIVQNVGIGAGALIGPLLSFPVKLLMSTGLMIVSIFTAVVLDRFVQSIG